MSKLSGSLEFIIILPLTLLWRGMPKAKHLGTESDPCDLWLCSFPSRQPTFFPTMHSDRASIPMCQSALLGFLFSETVNWFNKGEMSWLQNWRVWWGWIHVSRRCQVLPHLHKALFFSVWLHSQSNCLQMVSKGPWSHQASILLS